MPAKILEVCECIKSRISIPKGKSRPLLAGVFRRVEDIDVDVRILQEDIREDKDMDKGAENASKSEGLVVEADRQYQTCLGNLVGMLHTGIEITKILHCK